jgi:hypothetical protein
MPADTEQARTQVPRSLFLMKLWLHGFGHVKKDRTFRP